MKLGVCLVDLLYSVCLIGLVRRNEPDKPDRPDQTRSTTLAQLSYLQNIPGLLSDRFYCTALMCRPLRVGGAVRGGGGTEAVATVNVTGTLTEEAPVAFIVTVAL